MKKQKKLFLIILKNLEIKPKILPAEFLAFSRNFWGNNKIRIFIEFYAALLVSLSKNYHFYHFYRFFPHQNKSCAGEYPPKYINS
jgi:hypothetical protein